MKYIVIFFFAFSALSRLMGQKPAKEMAAGQGPAEQRPAAGHGPAEQEPAESSDRTSYTLFNDFETGELFGWEPYPYAQDIGFDALFFSRTQPTFKNSQYSLARPVRANDGTELSHGFTRRLNFYTTGSTRVKLAVYLQSDRDPDYLSLSLGTFAGQRYLYTTASPVKANQWIELDLPLSDFKKDGQPLAAGEHIQVITIKSGYHQVNYLFTYTILLDNFSINGERPRRFVADNPVSTDFEEFDQSVLNKHFFYGETLGLKVRAEGGIALRRVTGRLINGHGRTVGDPIRFAPEGAAAGGSGNGGAGDGSQDWGNGSIHRFEEKDLPGQWEIRLTGETKTGKTVEWGFKFLMPGKPVTGHPRLFFTEDALQDRIAHEKSPVAKKILDNALKNTDFMRVNVDSIREAKDETGETLVGGPYSKTGAGEEGNWSDWVKPINMLGRVIQAGSLRYAFIRDTSAGELAKKALLKLCAFHKWNNDWMLNRKCWTYFPVGYAIQDIAYGYDMLYGLLSVEERAFVRKAILDKGLKPFYRDMVEMNRMPSNLTNHIAVIVTGYGLAAMAIYGDEPENPFLEPFLSGMLVKARTFIERTYYEDGSYGEPKSSYLDMATRDLVELLDALERNFGVDYATTTNIGDFYKYPLYATFSNGLIQAYGDADRAYRGFTQEHAEWFVKRTGNPYLYNYIKPFWEAGNGGFFGYLSFRDDIKPVSRDALRPSSDFSAQGMVMRSGWGDSSTVITNRVGPNSNHYHYDQGSFQVMTNGNELLTDPGIGNMGYYANLDYPIYNTQAVGHNVMLVDHDPQSQEPADFDNGIAALRDWPKEVRHFAGKSADASEADLATVYKGKLDSYTRTLLYIPSGPLFLFDRVKGRSSQGHEYDWVFHAPENDDNKRSIRYKDGRMYVERPAARLTMDVLSPEIASSSIRDRDDKRFAESFITLSSKPDLAAVNFLAVLFPEGKPASGDFGAPPKTTRLETPVWLGAEVEDSKGIHYYGFFRKDPGAARRGKDLSETVHGFSTDAAHFTASYGPDGSVRSVWFEGTFFEGSGIRLKTALPVSCAFSTKRGSERGSLLLELQSEDASTLSVFLDQRPSGVLLNGAAVHNWQYDKDHKILMVLSPAGRQDFSVLK